ncbi:MAG TPA: hypothetical protein VF463_08620 [Sphingobium sp.]
MMDALAKWFDRMLDIEMPDPVPDIEVRRALMGDECDCPDCREAGE